MNLGIQELDVLLFVMKDEKVRKVFIDEAKSWGHSLADSRAMYKSVYTELCNEFSRVAKELGREMAKG